MMQINGLIRIAVVGHTNTGKTSLLRTLTRDSGFGEVANAPGTTRQVTRALCWLEGRPVLAWYDTPGIEDSIALRDWIETYPDSGQRLESYERVARFVKDAHAKEQFEQEHRVLKQVLESDAVLYVIDVRDPVLPKYRDELFLLAASAKPIVPVLNFLMNADPKPWTEALARLGLHVSLQFDTVSPPLDGQAIVFQVLGQVLGEQRPVFDDLAHDAQQARKRRREQGLALISELLVNVASAKWYGETDVAPTQQSLDQQQTAVRTAEQACVDALLQCYQFGAQDYLAGNLPWSEGRWHSDLFSVQAMGEMGLHLGKGAMTGALAGAAFDVMTAGLSLGAGTVVGAATGALWQSVGRWGSDVMARIKGQHEIRVADEVVLLLAMRQLQLLQALERRGHAAQSPVELEASQSDVRELQSGLPALLGIARRHHDWSTLTGRKSDSAARELAIHEVAKYLASILNTKET